MLDQLLEDVQYAIEETQLLLSLLEVTELLLVNRSRDEIGDRQTARHAHAVIVQALGVADCGQDFVKMWPNRLESM